MTNAQGFTHATGKDDWMTPPHVLDWVRAKWGAPTIDMAATRESTVCGLWIGPGHRAPHWRDGLTWDPALHPPSLIWCNPPYSPAAGGIAKWCAAMWRASRAGHTVAGLTYARTESVMWHEWLTRCQDLALIRGRLSFIDPATGEPKHPAPAGSVLFRFTPDSQGPPDVQSLVQVRRDGLKRVRSREFPLRLEGAPGLQLELG